MIPQGHQVGDATHERKDVDVINLVMIVLLLFLMIVICLMLSWGVLHFFNRRRETQQPPHVRMEERVAKFPAPQLIQQPGNEWEKTRNQEETQLETYGWVDRSAGIAHIPIARAMQLLVERGLPQVGVGQTRLQLMQSRPQTDQQPNQPITSPAPEGTP
ncbi:MAG TPA: hypothetical protein VGI85_15985 [Chthoniobacterales bacterium]|jgi:hypothetical protein